MLLKEYVRGYPMYEWMYTNFKKRANNIKIEEKTCSK